MTRAPTVLALLTVTACGLIDDSLNASISGTQDAQAQDEAALPACISGTIRTCTGWSTGCPDSTQSCEATGQWGPCPCNECSLSLDQTTCIWILNASEDTLISVPTAYDAGLTNYVMVKSADATIELPYVPSSDQCTETGGWYAEAAVTEKDVAGHTMTRSLTVGLCPASCERHLQSTEAEYSLYRGGCVILD